MLVSAIQHHKSLITICIYKYPFPLEAPSYPSPNLDPLGHQRMPGWAPCAYSSFQLIIYFTHDSVYMSMLLLLLLVLPSPFPTKQCLCLSFSHWCLFYVVLSVQLFLQDSAKVVGTGDHLKFEILMQPTLPETPALVSW